MTINPPDSAGLSRRDFIRFGLISGAVVSSGASLALLTGCSRNMSPADGFLHLRDKDLVLLRPLTPILLAGAFTPSEEKIEYALQQMDKLLHSASQGARAELFKLLDAMHLPPMRWYLTGTWRAFDKQAPEQLRDTVQQWSERDNGLARLSLRAINQPLVWAWYLTDEGVRHTGYPGTPQQVASV